MELARSQCDYCATVRSTQRTMGGVLGRPGRGLAIFTHKFVAHPTAEGAESALEFGRFDFVFKPRSGR